MILKDKKIILGLSGGIACYKSAELVRLLRKQGAEVIVVMTAASEQFITKLTLQALSGHPVRDSLFGLEAEHAMSHIELARWADMILIAPATANIIAKLAQGLADDLLTTLCLATKAPVFVAPAMNAVMWHHPTTQQNIQRLPARILGPDVGEQACGEFGLGRMLEPLAIMQELLRYYQAKKWVGKTVMITAGPTREALDPARCFTNFSSGKMGYALAEAALAEGAEVILISGPTSLEAPAGVTFISVESALQMRAAVFSSLSCVDIFIGAAAVADYRPKVVQENKIKKSGDTTLMVELIRNPDIIAEVSAFAHRPACVVGFAAESEEVLAHAKDKLARKKLDMIVANAITDGQVFGADWNEGWIIQQDGSVTLIDKTSKQQFAQKILQAISTYIAKRALGLAGDAMFAPAG